MAPIIRETANRSVIDHRLIATGQQQDLFDDTLQSFGLSPDLRINACWRTSDREAIVCAVVDALQRTGPDVVLVQGDTDTALIAATAASRLGLPIGHVEAGLRSFDLTRPFPEEQNRLAISKMATLHFAPSAGAASNLKRESAPGHIYVTGNTGIDALVMVSAANERASGSGPVLVTCHRRENFGEPLERICLTLRCLADDGLKFLIPLHSNPKSADAMRAIIADHASIAMVPPLSYHDLITAIRAAPFVLSDSGGLQEECAALGVPLLLMRENTERPEVVESGNCVLVGSDTDAIIHHALTLAHDPQARKRMSNPVFPYGEGRAAVEILDAITAWHDANWTEDASKRSGLALQ